MESAFKRGCNVEEDGVIGKHECVQFVLYLNPQPYSPRWASSMRHYLIKQQIWIRPTLLPCVLSGCSDDSKGQLTKEVHGGAITVSFVSVEVISGSK